MQPFDRWNATSVALPADSRIHAVFEEQVRRTPDATAVVQGEVRVTYTELDARANALAHELVRAGVTNDQLVGLCAPRSIDALVGILATLKAGGAYVPLDPGYPAERLAFMLEDGDVRVLLADAESAARLPAHRARVIPLGGTARAAEPPPRTGDGESLAYVMYTSGSTGRPKGVMVPHRAVIRLVKGATYASFAPDEVFLHLAPMSFDASTFEIWGPLLNGGRVAVVPSLHPSLQEIGEAIKKHGVTTLWLTAGLFHLMVNERLEDLRPLRQLLSGGDVLSVAHCQRVLRELPHVALINGYGPTETTTFACCHRIKEPLGASVPIGAPIANTTVHILDDAMQETDGEGELWIGGLGVARGYLARPELTAERFVTQERYGRLYRTGDRARWLPDGTVSFHGRADGQVKLRGFRVELGEVESTLAQHPKVRAAAAAVREPRPGDKRLCAWYVGDATAAELRAFMAERVPDHMVPAALARVEALPLGATGKVDRAALPEIAFTQAPVESPRGELEEVIAGIWRAVLGLARVSGGDNFFEIGGSSLHLIEVHARLEAKLGKQVAITRLFQFPTIDALAAHLRGAAESSFSAVQERAAKARRGGTSSGVAIVGMSGRFPGANGVRELWRNLLAGTESISLFDEAQLEARDPAVKSAAYVRARGIVDDVDQFDAAFFGINPREAELMDPQHRLFLECAWEALEDAGHDPAQYAGSIGVWAGQSLNTYLLANLAKDRAFLDRVTGEYQVGSYTTVLGNDKDYIATRVCYRLDLGGPGITVQSACSTSLVAVCQAVSALMSHQCDMALAGGASITFPQRRGYLYNEGGMVSPDGHCRTFDKDAQGTVFSSGVSVVLMKRVEDALADGDHIYAVIRGAALNNDGARKVGYTAPSVDRQAEVVATAQAVAGVSPESIGYVETHGTGTPLGDPIEVVALTRAFRAGTDAKAFCALGALKSNVGHMEVASGAAGLIKAALVVNSGKVPATLHYKEPNPKLELEGSPFFVNGELIDWRGPLPRRAGVSSFGVGGTNAHVVIEQPPERRAAGPEWPHQLLLLSARTPAALDAASARLAEALKSGVSLADAACTLQVGRRHFAHRRAVVAASSSDAIAALGDRDRQIGGAHEGAAPSVAFLFPGQGAQTLGMGAGLYAGEPSFRADVDRCCEILRPHLGFDLRTLIFRPPPDDAALAARLDQTEVTQPALFVIEYALAKLWTSWGLRPEAMIGHSVGEYVAACLAGVFSLEDALALVAARGKLIQSLPSGAMLAVRLPESEVLSLLSPPLSLAAVNGPKLCVVAGPHDAIEGMESRLAQRGDQGRRLRTSHAFHSSMMDPVLAAFTARVRSTKLSPPKIPFVSSPTGAWITDAQATDPEYWARHVRDTVRFAQGVSLLDGKVLLEVGPGRTLATLSRQALPKATAIASLGDPAEQGGETAAFLDAAGRLWAAGVKLDWSAVQKARGIRRVPLPAYPFERTRHWIEPVAPQQPAAAAAAPVDSDVENVLRAQLELMSLQLAALRDQGDA